MPEAVSIATLVGGYFKDAFVWVLTILLGLVGWNLKRQVNRSDKQDERIGDLEKTMAEFKSVPKKLDEMHGDIKHVHKRVDDLYRSKD